MLSQTTMIVAAILAAVLILSVIFILTRYKKVAPDELLVKFGKTGKTEKTTIVVQEYEVEESDTEKADSLENAETETLDPNSNVKKTSREIEVTLPSKIIQGGGTIVLPIIQGFKRMSMKPLQFEANIEGLDSQSIRTQLKIVLTTAISHDKAIQQNAAIRFLSTKQDEIEEIIKKISFGEIRGVMTRMPIEQINADRNKFLREVRKSLEQELKKVGFELTNINISEINDDADYIKNLGKNAATRTKMQAEADIAAQEKEGKIKIANTRKDESIAIAKAEKEKEITVAQNQQEQEVGVAQAERDKEIKLAEADKERESGIATQNAEKAANIANAQADAEAARAEAAARQKSTVAAFEAEGETKRANSLAEQTKNVATAQADAEATKNEQEAKKQVRIAQAQQNREAETIKATQEKEAKQSEYESDRRQRAAEANKRAGVAEQKAKIDVASATAEAGQAEADAKKIKETAFVEAEMQVAKTRQERQLEVNEAEAKANEAKLNATEIIPAQKAKEKVIIDAEAEKEKIILAAQAEKQRLLEEAKGEAEATKMKLEAEAEGQKKLLLAQAEGKKASLLAEAEKEQQMQLAPAIAFERMLQASAENPSLAVEFKMVDQYKHIAAEQAHMLENLKLGNVTVYGDSSTGAQFVKSLISNVTPGMAMLNEGFMGQFKEMFGKGKKTEIEAPKSGNDEKTTKK